MTTRAKQNLRGERLGEATASGKRTGRPLYGTTNSERVGGPTAPSHTVDP